MSNTASDRLCAEIADLARRLITHELPEGALEPLLASRLVPLDKGDGGVRPVGVGEALRRLTFRVIGIACRDEVGRACGAKQVCAGHKAGCEVLLKGRRWLS